MKKNNAKSINFGERLKQVRKDKGLSQSELAEKMGYKQSATISNLEINKSTPDINTLKKLSEILEVDLHWLITGDIYREYKLKFMQLYSYINKEIGDLSQQNHRLAAEIAEIEKNPGTDKAVDEDIINMKSVWIRRNREKMLSLDKQRIAMTELVSWE